MSTISSYASKPAPLSYLDKLIGTNSDGSSTKNFNLAEINALIAGDTSIVISELSQLGTPVSGYYELTDPGLYKFADDIDFGTNGLKLMTIDGRYVISGNNLNTLSYSGTDPFIVSNSTGQILFIDKVQISTPNATAVEMINNTGGSLLFYTPLFVDCQKVADLENLGFLTIEQIAMVDCGDGITCDNVGVIWSLRLQWSLGKDAGGVALTALGASSQRLISIGSETQAAATEAIYDIQATYAGVASLSSGVHTNGTGEFFKTGSKDQTTPGVGVLNIGGVPNSKSIGSWTVQGNLEPTSIADPNEWTNFNFDASVVETSSNERFTITNTTTGELRYDGLKDFEGGLFCTISGFGSGGASEYQFRAVVNGIPLTPISILSANEMTGTMSSTALLSDIPLSTNDLIRIQVQNVSNDSNFTGKFVTARIQ